MRQALRLLPWALGLYFVGWLLVTTFRYALNIPVEDDFGLYLDRWMQMEDATSWGEKWRILSQQHGMTEHRFAFGVLVARVITGLWGHTDFVAFTGFGLLALLVLTWELGRIAFRRLGLSMAYFLPVIALLYQPQLIYRSFLWPGAALQYFPTILLGFWAFKYLPRTGWLPFVLASLCTVTAPYSHTHGMFIGWVGLAVLLTQRRWGRAAGYAAVVGGLHLVYFLGYYSEFTPRRFLGVDVYLQSLLLGYGNFYNFINGIDGQIRWDALAMTVGALVIGGYLFGLVRFVTSRPYRDVRTDWPWLALAGTGGWLLLAIAAVAISRSHDPHYLYNNRYLTVSLPFACFSYLCLMAVLKNKARTVVAGVVGAVCLVLWLYHQYFWIYSVRRAHDGMMAAAFNFKQFQRWEIYPGGDRNWEANMDSTTRLAIRRGLYRLPGTYLTDHESEVLNPAEPTAAPVAVQTTTAPESIQLTNETLPVEENDHVFLRLSSDRRTYLVAATKRLGGDRRYVTTGNRYAPTGFHAELYPARFLPGTYRAAVVWGHGERLTVAPLNQTLQLGP
jgi:hypothetical protein